LTAAIRYEYEEEMNAMDDAGSHKPKPALAGWLLVYVEYTVLVFVLRGLSLFFLLTGDIGIMAGSGDFRFHFCTSVLLELLSAAVLVLIWRRSRIAPWAVVVREAAVPAVIAARVLLFGAESEVWLPGIAETAAGIGWIVCFLRSRRVRGYFAAGRGTRN
jgi:hypothetical protein